MMKRRLAAAGLAIGVIAAFTGSALAGHLTSGVKSYTGCLVSKDGVIIKISEGTAPTSRCANGQVEVHFSGGDITRIAVTGALTGGGDNGEVTIGLKPEFTLPAGCDAGDVAKWDGDVWACGTDEDTTYAAGTGLDLGGTTFAIEPDYRVKNSTDCGTGQFATGFDSTGTIVCGAPTAGARAYAALQNPASGIGIPDNSGYQTVVTLVVPAGTYSITAIGSASQAADRDWGLSCDLEAGGTVLSEGFVDGDSGIDHRTMAMMNVSTFGAPTTLSVACATLADGVGVRFMGIQAITVG
jgi:hypothetical protein